MGIGDHGILAVGKGRTNVAKDTVAAMDTEDAEVISASGEDVPEEEAKA